MLTQVLILKKLKQDFNMNGFEQIKSFYSWVFNNPDKIRPTHISLYLFLINQNNRSYWVEWFKCPYDLAMQGACIGNKNTYYKCLDDLVIFKLIEYRKGINNHKAPLIKIIRLYDSEPLSGNVPVPLSEPQTEPLTVLLNKNIYKLITENYKLINESIVEWISESKNKEEKNPVDWSALINQFNKETKKQTRVIPDKAKKQIIARLKEGFTKGDLLTAIINCYNDPYHKETGHKFLTLEFISRADKLDKYSTMGKHKQDKKERNGML